MAAKQCPLDISLLWSAELGSPVYSAPVILPSPIEGRKQIAVATLLNTVELLEGDGSVPVSWPVELEGLMFLGSPAVHDIDGDGTQDICVAATDATIMCFSTGDREPYMKDYKWHLDPRRVSQDRLSKLRGTGEGSGDDQVDPGSSRGGRRLQAEDVAPGPDDSWENMDLDAMAAYLDRNEDWGAYDHSADQADDYYWGYPSGEVSDQQDSGVDVNVDAHVLASPVFVDVDEDGEKEIIVAVTYFSSPSSTQQDAGQQDMGGAQGRGYVASALAWGDDLSAMEWKGHKDLGETLGDEKSSSAYASPTVADIDADGELDIIVGTAEGKLHIFNAKLGEERMGFPLEFGAIKAQVAVADVDDDSQLEIFFGDASGTLVCLKPDAKECWRRELGGGIMHSVTLGDVNSDSYIDVVVGISLPNGEGQVWALNAATGEPLDGFPVGLGNSKGISAPILIVDLHDDSTADTVSKKGQTATGASPEDPGRGLHLLAPSEDGHVYVIEAVSGGCRSKIDVGGSLTSMVLADDVDGDTFLDLVVGTMAGEVAAISTNIPFHPQNAWRSPVRGHLNGFVHGSYQGVYFTGSPSKYHQVMGPEFGVPFKIVDRRPQKDDRKYRVTISSGNLILYNETLTTAGEHEAKISLRAPKQYTFRIEMTNVFHQVFEDHITVAYSVGFHFLVKWIILIPLVLTASLIWWAPGPRDGGSIPVSIQRRHRQI